MAGPPRPIVQLVAMVRKECPPLADDPAQVVAIKCANPIPIDWGTGTLFNGPSTVVPTGAAVLVLPADPNRVTAVIQNTGPVNIRWGAVGVTATTGIRLVPNGGAIVDEPFIVQQALYAISEGPGPSEASSVYVDELTI
jgi:hypothetical protein